MLPKLIKDLICFFVDHDTRGWIRRPDIFLAKQFDPSGIHWMHSHYRPDAMWSRLAQLYPEKYDKQECRCRRCGALFWEWHPINLAGVPWGPPDDYDRVMEVMIFEMRNGIPFDR